MTTYQEDDDPRFRAACSSFARVVDRVLKAAQAAGAAITDDQKAATLARCLDDSGGDMSCFDLVTDMFEFVEAVGVPMSDPMMFALACDFSIRVQPPSPKGDPKQPQRPQRRAFRPSIIKSGGGKSS